MYAPATLGRQLTATMNLPSICNLVLARALENRPRILVAENPTRGLDIRATAFVHQQLRAAAVANPSAII